MGWIAAKELVRDLIPARVQGVYLAYRAEDQDPFFLQRSDAGSHKGRDPTISVAELENAWIPESHVVYIGKAHLTASSDLQRRVWAFV